MVHFLKRLVRETKGATAVEYGLILALVFLGMLTGIQRFGQSAIGVWTSVSNAVTGGA